MLTNQSIGYIDAPIPKGLNLKEEINRMRREKNAVILAHYYQTGDIQDIADFVGDSLALAQQACSSRTLSSASCAGSVWSAPEGFSTKREKTSPK